MNYIEKILEKMDENLNPANWEKLKGVCESCGDKETGVYSYFGGRFCLACIGIKKDDEVKK